MQNNIETRVNHSTENQTEPANELGVVDLDATYYTDDSSIAEARNKAFIRERKTKLINALTAVSVFMLIAYGFISLLSFLGSH